MRLEDRLTLGELLKTYQLRTGIQSQTIARVLGRGWGEAALSQLFNDKSATLVDPERLAILAMTIGCTRFEYTQLLRAANFYPEGDELHTILADEAPRLDQYQYPAYLSDDRGFIYQGNAAWTDLFGALPEEAPIHMLLLLLDSRHQFYQMVIDASYDDWKAQVYAELDFLWVLSHRLLIPEYAEEPAWRATLLTLLGTLPEPGGGIFRQLWQTVRRTHATEEAEEHAGQRLAQTATFAGEPQFATTAPLLDRHLARVRDAARHLSLTFDVHSSKLEHDARFVLTTWTPLRLAISTAFPSLRELTAYADPTL